MLIKKMDKKKHVYLVLNKYILKIDNKKKLHSENMFLKLYKSSPSIEKIVFYNKSFNFAIYRYSKGEKNINNNVFSYLSQLKNIINQYVKYSSKGFGDISNLEKTWKVFLTKEIDAYSIWMEEEVEKKAIVKNSINKLGNYKFTKKIIHGDLGVYNIIFQNNTIKTIIDPRTIVGDPLYDLIYFLFSKPSFIKNLKISSFLNSINEPQEKILNLMFILLYIRIAIQKKHNEPITSYELLWKELQNFKNS